MNEIVEAPTMVEDCVKEYIPTKGEALRSYSISIEFLTIGCIVRVGCKSVPFSSIKEGLTALNNYVVNPVETRKIWEARFSKEEEL